MSPREKTLMEMFVATGAAAGDDRDVDGTGDAGDEVEVVTEHGAVALDGIEEDFSRTPAFDLPSERDWAAMQKNLLTGAPGHVLRADYIDRHNDSLIPEPLRRLLNEGSLLNARGANLHFIGPIGEGEAEMLDGLDAAADCQGTETFAGEIADQVKIWLAAIGRCADIKQDKFVDTAPGVNLDGTHDGSS